MQLSELQRAVERLNPDERRKLLSFLIALEIRADEADLGDLTRRSDAKEGWISLREAKEKLRDHKNGA
jgi:hypothetical protein